LGRIPGEGFKEAVTRTKTEKNLSHQRVGDDSRGGKNPILCKPASTTDDAVRPGRTKKKISTTNRKTKSEKKRTRRGICIPR